MSRSRSARERREGRVGGRTDGRKKGRTDGRTNVWEGGRVEEAGGAGRGPRPRSQAGSGEVAAAGFHPGGRGGRPAVVAAGGGGGRRARAPEGELPAQGQSVGGRGLKIAAGAKRGRCLVGRAGGEWWAAAVRRGGTGRGEARRDGTTARHVGARRAAGSRAKSLSPPPAASSRLLRYVS